MGILKLKWKQVNAWRLARQGLTPRLKRGHMLEAASRALGVQAQVLSAAGQALWARVEGLRRADVDAALWEERTLVKTWAMRTTLHLLPASDLPLFAAARGYLPLDWSKYFEYYGVSRELMELYLAAAPEVLSVTPMTREQYSAAMGKLTGSAELVELIQTANWGTPMKPLAWSGHLCFGPSQGTNITFVNARKWLGGWKAIEPEAAWKEIGRRYLRTYGPAKPENFAHWWGGHSGFIAARKLFHSLEDELEEVEVEGWRALALRSTLEEMQAAAPRGTVNLLPLFDAYTLGLGRHAELEPHLPLAQIARVFRPQGWISAVILMDGVMRGTWELKSKGKAAVLTALPFSALPSRIKKGVEAEAARLGEYLGVEVEVSFAQD